MIGLVHVTILLMRVLFLAVVTSTSPPALYHIGRSTTGRSHHSIAIVGGFTSERASGPPHPNPIVLVRGVSYERTNTMNRDGGGDSS